MREAAERVFGHKECGPKKPWIKEDTLELLEKRAELVRSGKPTEAEALNKPIKRSAKRNRRTWIEEGLEEKYWDPVKMLSRDRAPRVVHLDGSDKTKKVPQIYAEYLAEDHWGRAPESQAR
eukprot:2836023-Alexandrium_andersonii.AAC.1